MSKKPEFRPRITRVKLNPEQAVLTCNCYLTWTVYWDSAKIQYFIDTGFFSDPILCTGPGKSSINAQVGMPGGGCYAQGPNGMGGT